MEKLFETERLYFRRFTLDDAALILELNRIPAVVYYVHEPVLENLDHASQILIQHILPQYHLYQLGRWAVYEKATDQFIGWCGLKYLPDLKEIDLGYRFMPSSWGKGYATEAALAAIQYGFSVLQLETIIGRAHVENLASLKVLRKIGMLYIDTAIVDQCPVETYQINRPRKLKNS